MVDVKTSLFNNPKLKINGNQRNKPDTNDNGNKYSSTHVTYTTGVTAAATTALPLLLLKLPTPSHIFCGDYQYLWHHYI
ncbi:hypothetical protein DDB_G0284231 [Dictyostelium discoideum AX4]|uniref:Uncharacterized protein n=1 Tax=Dictyostelium discoideum TaxID=44689 RepID=Q54PY4_DICDI|nr:hypothetical protein DDB_G0284231 [Dictyostelium discoideum AX4]EAL65304.1 hypothetical protein DDB_G0284231 [Dictyostelium discoideum AX4]|eukprot:XP_638661.1 hypothetical protein DDB_G0284231 [Dictyostelium discoideum AX4]